MIWGGLLYDKAQRGVFGDCMMDVFLPIVTFQFRTLYILLHCCRQSPREHV